MARVRKSRRRKLRAGNDLPADVIALFEKRANYAKADATMEQILQRCEPGAETILCMPGKKPRRVTLVDQFAETNAVWSGSNCKRMILKERDLKPQDR